MLRDFPPFIFLLLCLVVVEEAFAYREDKHQSYDDFLAQRIDVLSVNRSKLIKFLKGSQHYNAGSLLGRFGDSGLHAELSIIYFRVGFLIDKFTKDFNATPVNLA